MESLVLIEKYDNILYYDSKIKVNSCTLYIRVSKKCVKVLPLGEKNTAINFI